MDKYIYRMFWCEQACTRFKTHTHTYLVVILGI